MKIFDSSYGVSLGHKLATNLWVSLGYNFVGFSDGDFEAADYSAKGVFLRFRYKIDQETIKDALKRVDQR